ncbi:hypothetical protein L1N85_13490 [Paenibacillus alkaliterrae]|uniref:kanamycin nucleotidyltransferase C-terminal domain-containing protein n=1 Tax=Paenibacillus alkaliterrae TaxID=320909 RepID=UPI001F1ECAF8|nr:kanamycin nucleotidyltransferase C-terminal domain-containing protein [Paenibacillus alkaliterrae]MCF2939434.1 hypothetical protein [Paenibacillus alkaliterrae]
MASFEEVQTTIIADCRLLYVRSDEDHARFMKLREKIAVMQEPEQGLQLANKAESLLRDAYVHLYKMTRADENVNISFYRTEAYGVLTLIMKCLALVNQTYLTAGWGKNKDQMLQLPLKPAHYEELYEKIIQSLLPAEIISACEQLTAETLVLIKLKKESYACASSYPDRMKGFYEETKGTLDKIITACEKRDYNTAFFSAIGIQDEIAHFLYYTEKGHFPCRIESNTDYQDVYRRIGLPDLASLLDPQNLAPLQTAVERLDILLESHLRAQGVKMNRFQSLDEFAEFLLTRNQTISS